MFIRGAAATLPAAVLFAALLLAWPRPADALAPCAPPSVHKVAAPSEIRAYFKSQRKHVITFLGYSGAGYEDQQAMLQAAREALKGRDPRRTIVNIGATPEGIGAVYQLAKDLGYTTSGIVSSQWRATGTPLSPCVDIVFLVKDETWGGFLKGTRQLSPTSSAMVGVSDQLVAIGGGEVSRDEAAAAERAGKPVRYVPADMNHAVAVERARKRNEPVPTDFSGAVAAARASRQ
jgi:hypothetical protein